MSDNGAKIAAKRAEIEKRAKGGGGFFGKLFGGGGGGDLAQEYISLGNLCKMDKLWNEAGQAFENAADRYRQQGDSQHDCATQFSEAANCYRKVDPNKAVACLQRSAEIYTDMGRFTMAAKIHVSMGELYENELADPTNCITHYQRAADYYNGEESKSSANKCLEKVAQHHAELEHWKEAVNIYEQIAFWTADHPTLKFGAKNHFFKALLCCLNKDPLDTAIALKKYEDAYPSFTDAREAKLIREILAAIEAQNEDDFTVAVASFDRISKLDNWQTGLLVKVKRRITQGEDEDDLR
ncbi:unnamed protein product, partial [Mesorhabditis spiculigera]